MTKNPTSEVHAAPENEREEPTIEQIVELTREIIDDPNAEQIGEFEAVREVLSRWDYTVLSFEELDRILSIEVKNAPSLAHRLPEQIESVHDAAAIAKMVGSVTKSAMLAERAVEVAKAELEKVKALALAEAAAGYDKKWQFEEIKASILEGSEAVQDAEDVLDQAKEVQIEADATKAEITTLESLVRAMLYSRQGTQNYMTYLTPVTEDFDDPPAFGTAEPWPESTDDVD